MSTIETPTPDWYDIPAKWMSNEKAPVSTHWFQLELNLIGGKTLDGKPHYQIVWGMDVENVVMRDRYRDRWMPRYLYKTLTWVEERPPSPGFKMVVPIRHEKLIGTPRFYVESYLPPEVINASGTASGVDVDGDHYSSWASADGDYWPMIELCDHDEFGICCHNAFEEDRNCHGLFRVPNRRDLDSIRRLWQQMQAERRHSPNEPVPKDVANNAYHYAVERERKRREAIDVELAYNGANFMRSHGFTGAAKYHALPGVAIPGVTQGWSAPTDED